MESWGCCWGAATGMHCFQRGKRAQAAAGGTHGRAVGEMTSRWGLRRADARWRSTSGQKTPARGRRTPGSTGQWQVVAVRWDSWQWEVDTVGPAAEIVARQNAGRP